MKNVLSYVIIPPATKLGGYTGITPSVCPSVCRRAWLGKIARLGIGCRGGYFVPLGQPHSSFLLVLSNYCTAANDFMYLVGTKFV